MSAISQLKPARFAGIAYPYTECRVKLSQRHHVHVYLHTPGGEVEKFGRALYTISQTIPAHDTLRAPYANFYANTLPQLWAVWETGATADLEVPNLGTIRAFATEGMRTIRGNVSSGEPVEVSYLEDQQTLFALSALFQPSTDGIGPQLTMVLRRCAGLVEVNLLDRLAAAVESLLAARDSALLLARVVMAKAQGVISLCEQVAKVPALSLPANFEAYSPLLDLHLSAITILQDAIRRARPTVILPAPARMSVTQLSAWRYGTTARAGEVLALNELTDPLAVPRGALVRFYA